MKSFPFLPKGRAGSAAGAALGLLLAAGRAQAPAPAASPAVSYSAFQVIGNYNIFNANRVGYTPGAAQVRLDTLALVGTIQSAAGQLALFDGSDRAYRKGVREGEKIAEFTVTRITAAGVELTREAKPLSLAVGQQLRRPPGGAWTLGGAVRRAEPAEPAVLPPALPADASDPLRQLMEQRQKLLKQ